jgi:hypothetical protein
MSRSSSTPDIHLICRHGSSGPIAIDAFAAGAAKGNGKTCDVLIGAVQLRTKSLAHARRCTPRTGIAIRLGRRADALREKSRSLFEW